MPQRCPGQGRAGRGCTSCRRRCKSAARAGRRPPDSPRRTSEHPEEIDERVKKLTDDEKNMSYEFKPNEIFKASDLMVDSLTQLISKKRQKLKQN